jgi:polyhydroxyalkanoate synthesis repressor PhaR
MAGNPGGSSAMITIKKYSNRRLYDTSRSSYINLDDLAEMIRNGEEIRVVDAKTADDLTRPVLVQVLLERPGALDAIPVSLFHRMIRYGGTEAIHPWVTQQLAVGFELMEAQLQAFESQFGWEPPGPAPRDAAPQQREVEPEQTEVEGDEATEAEPPVAKVDAELAALRERLADLEARLGGG